MKISQLKIKKKTSRESRDVNGKLVRTFSEIEVPRKVKTVQGGARFGHYIIDLIIIMAVAFLLGYLGVVTPARHSYYSGSQVRFQYVFDFSGYIITFLYYAISEGLMGRTIGKIATSSYVIDEYAKKPGFGAILLRTVCRLVPFEAFSCLGERGWHDKWSKTYVVTKQEWEVLKKELKGESISDNDEILD